MRLCVYVCAHARYVCLSVGLSVGLSAYLLAYSDINDLTQNIHRWFFHLKVTDLVIDCWMIGFYGISAIVGYLRPNLLYIYIYIGAGQNIGNTRKFQTNLF